jgi:sec-independent protein translocase protein TatA
MDIGPTELLIVLAIVVILFGGGRIAKLGGELGNGMREFRKGLSGEDDVPNAAAPGKAAPDKAVAAPQAADSTVGADSAAK